MKKRIYAAFALILCAAVFLASCDAPKLQLSLSTTAAITLRVGDVSEEFALDVTAEEEWDASHVRAVVSNASVIRVECEKRAGDGSHLYFRVIALQRGVAELYFESLDGEVRTSALSVLVEKSASVSDDDSESGSEDTGSSDGTEDAGGESDSTGETDEETEGGEDTDTSGDSEGDEETLPETGEGEDSTECAYVLNTNSKKIHYPTCHTIKNLKAENRAETSKTVEELKLEGYTTCGVCKPN